MKSNFFRQLFILLIFNLFFFALSPANASRSEIEDQLGAAGIMGWGYMPSPDTMPGLIQYIISAFLGLLGIIFIVLIIYAGFHWMTARGDEQKVTLAKESLARAVIGLIIIVAAYSITYFVFSSLPDDGGGGSSGNQASP